MSTPGIGAAFRHFAYGNAHVVAVSTLFSTGQELVTVQWFGPAPDGNVHPSPVTTYPLEDFQERFEAVKE